MYSHYKVHQAIADRKVKKQLAPLREELDALRTENEALRQALAGQPPAGSGGRAAAAGTGI